MVWGSNLATSVTFEKLSKAHNRPNLVTLFVDHQQPMFSHLSRRSSVFFLKAFLSKTFFAEKVGQTKGRISWSNLKSSKAGVFKAWAKQLKLLIEFVLPFFRRNCRSILDTIQRAC
jgi:hypothetical protein